MKITNEGFAILENDTHIGRWVEEHKRLDFDQNALPQVLKYINKGDVVLDAGANIGCYAYAFLKQVDKDGFIMCFEPSEKTYECLEYNLKNNSNVILFNEALGAKKGTVNIIEENNNTGMNFCEVVKSGATQIRTIDSLELNRLDFIKIDVEGFELDVLIGGEQTIKKYNPILYIEINEHTFKRKGITKFDIFKMLDSLGYSYRNIYEEQGMYDDQFDIICFNI